VHPFIASVTISYARHLRRATGKMDTHELAISTGIASRSVIVAVKAAHHIFIRQTGSEKVFVAGRPRGTVCT